MDIRPAYSCLLGRPWIHGANAVTSTLHQKLKYPAKGKIVTVYGEEEYVVSFIDETKYLGFIGEAFESPRIAYELVPQLVPETKHVYTPPKVIGVIPAVASLKDARAVVEEGGCTIWGQLPDIPYKSNKWSLGRTAKDQKREQHPRPEGLKHHFISKGVNAIGEDEDNYNIDKWIFPTPDEGLDNWKTKDIVSISYSQE